MFYLPVLYRALAIRSVLKTDIRSFSRLDICSPVLPASAVEYVYEAESAKILAQDGREGCQDIITGM